MKKGIVFLLLAVIVVAGWFVWKERFAPRQGAAGTIGGNGIIEATEVEVGARISGRLLDVFPREGDSVSRGDLVATLESGGIEGQVAQAEANLAAAGAALRELEAGARPEEIRQLEARLETARTARRQAQARLDLLREGTREEQVESLRAALDSARASDEDAAREMARLSALFEQEAIPRRDLDQARTRRDLAASQVEIALQRLREAEAGTRPQEIAAAEAALAGAAAQVEAAQADLDLALAGARPEAIDAARARVEQARGALRTARDLLGDTLILSPLDGHVILRGVEPGEIVTPGLPILRLADLRRVWLRVYVPEAKVGLVKTGQKAEVTVDSYPGRNYPGRVTEIAQEPEFTPKNIQTREERVKLVFGVKVEVENGDFDLKPGMPADAIIFVGGQ